jgi:hypothetical protein
MPSRFVVMSIPQKTDRDKPIQLKLFDIDRYTCGDHYLVHGFKMVVGCKYLLPINWCKNFFTPK